MNTPLDDWKIGEIYDDGHARSKCVRLTDTQVILANGNRYLRKSGRKVGAAEARFLAPAEPIPESAGRVQATMEALAKALVEARCAMPMCELRHGIDGIALVWRDVRVAGVRL